MLQHLSILDQSAAVAGLPHATVINHALDLAVTAETLGYRRFWVSEHHSHPAIVGSAPEVLLAALSQKTHKIRLGSAGVMLPHYQAFKVAEQFRVLESLAPGRIDLGVGRAPGSDMKTARLLNPAPQPAAYFPQQVQELDAWLQAAEFPIGHPGRGVKVYPAGPTCPQLWILGSSDYGAQLAAHLGLPYVFAHFITDGESAKQAIGLYYQNFKPSERFPQPQVIVCLWALAAAHTDEAFYHFRSRAKWKIDRQKGVLGSMESPEHALDSLTPHELDIFQHMCQKSFVGESSVVMEKIAVLAHDLGVEEVAIITWAHAYEARKSSYELLATHL